MEALERVASEVWGPVALAVFSLAGLYMTYMSGGIQFVRFGRCIGGTLKNMTRGGGQGGMSGFQALSTALGGTVGTGNVAGVTLALAMGGPGVLFWMWVSAFIGMATKYSEVLPQRRRREGRWTYVLHKGRS